MQISTKANYAIIALVDLSLQPIGQFTSLHEVSERQKISKDYLQNLFLRLNAHGVINSKRGPNGGHSLAMEPEAISLFDIMSAVGENFCPLVRKSNSEGSEARELTDDLWNDLCMQTSGYLRSVTLSDVIYSRAVLGKELFPMEELRSAEMLH